jgi:hypothetical protein
MLAGFIGGVEGKETPDFPLGLTFAGSAWSEAKLLRLAYEQALHYAASAARTAGALAAAGRRLRSSSQSRELPHIE